MVAHQSRQGSLSLRPGRRGTPATARGSPTTHRARRGRTHRRTSRPVAGSAPRATVSLADPDERVRDARVVLAERRFPHAQRGAVVGERLLGLVARHRDLSATVDVRGDARAVLTEQLALDRESAIDLRFGLVVTTELAQRRREVRMTGRDDLVLGARPPRARRSPACTSCARLRDLHAPLARDRGSRRPYPCADGSPRACARCRRRPR